jgi:hypothetical protein
MTKLDLRPVGFPCGVEVHAAAMQNRSGGSRLKFLIGENHKDRETKRPNLLTARGL